MIVMGTHGHGLLSRMFMGIVDQRVLAGSEIPTLLVKQCKLTRQSPVHVLFNFTRRP